MQYKVREGRCADPIKLATNVTAVYEAEAGSYDSSSKTSNNNHGASGDAFVDMGGRESWVQFDSVHGGWSSGTCTLSFRYANGGSTARPCDIIVNGENIGTVSFSPTSAWNSWSSEAIKTSCISGSNVIRVSAATDWGGPNLDSLAFSKESGSGESQPSGTVTLNDFVVPIEWDGMP